MLQKYEKSTSLHFLERLYFGMEKGFFKQRKNKKVA